MVMRWNERELNAIDSRLNILRSRSNRYYLSPLRPRGRVLFTGIGIVSELYSGIGIVGDLGIVSLLRFILHLFEVFSTSIRCPITVNKLVIA